MPMKAYKYRIYPTKAQAKKFEQWLDICCELYNAALQERRDAWRVAKKSVNYTEQCRQLTEVKEFRDDIRAIPVIVLRDPLRRLDKAFRDFFRRVKIGGKPGHPRFRSRFRYRSFAYVQDEGFSIEKGKLKLYKIGHVKIRLHRQAEGKIKNLTISHSPTGKWYACLTAEVEDAWLAQSSEQIGIDCGLEKFAALSSGEFIENPRYLRKGEKALAKAQRKLSEAACVSPERAKRRRVVARIYERIKNCRRNFAHQHSRKLVNKFGFIAFENLNIKGMVQNSRLAKSISDAAWGQLITLTTYKAEWAGRSVVLVDPRNTSKKCSGCGEMVKKDLSERLHDCPSCGLVLDRDLNAAKNILALGLQGLDQIPKSLALISKE